MESKKIVDSYLKKTDWRVKESSSAPFSYGAMSKYMVGEVSKDYWLREVYPEYIAQAYIDNHIHIHDLGGLTLYCCGYSLADILAKGVRGVPNLPTSGPAKHFGSALAQVVNLTTIFQNDIMGAVAFNSVDTLLAPYIKKDNLNYEEVKQVLQNFIFAINSNSRHGSEPAFSNITLDLTPSSDMINSKALIAGESQDFTYKDCQKEMDLFNRVFCDIMSEGDNEGKLFSYPIPTYNINSRFDWDNPNNDSLWEMAGKYGIPYFANYINSDMDPEDARSMCCRLRLDLRELRKRSGGLFGSGDSTGSIGVVTLNLPRMAYEASDEKEFFVILDKYLSIAKDSLEIKRVWLQENIIDTNAIPAFMEYVGTIDNHFSTIGNVGMNEMCENLMGKGISDPSAKEFAKRVNEFIRNRLADFQEETGNLYNLEATPAESTSYRLAKNDIEACPGIITQGVGEDVYYTNSCHLPVKEVTSIDKTFKHQEDLQVQYTGGTVIHCYLEGAISGEQAKQIVRSVNEKYKVPYMSLSPISRYCPEHGYISELVDDCPICNKQLDMYQRITGYLRNVKNFNKGKAAEFNDRKQLKG